MKIRDVVRLTLFEDQDVNGLFHLEVPPALIGISERYLGNAEEDFKSFVNYVHPYWAIKRLIEDRSINMDGATIIDVASGFGNTVIPILRDNGSCHVIASDLSANILKILLREARKEGVGDRVEAIVCDAQDLNLWRPESADMVIGGAALHHMIDPSLTISAALAALKPSGVAIFMEPMEVGHAVVRLAIEEALQLPAMQENEAYRAGGRFLSDIAKDIDARTFHDTRTPAYQWEQLDDKWVFPRSYLDELADGFSCKVQIISLDNGSKPIETKIVSSLEQYGGMKASEHLPPEALKIFERYDAAFSPAARRDIAVEAAVLFVKS